MQTVQARSLLVPLSIAALTLISGAMGGSCPAASQTRGITLSMIANIKLYGLPIVPNRYG